MIQALEKQKEVDMKDFRGVRVKIIPVNPNDTISTYKWNYIESPETIMNRQKSFTVINDGNRPEYLTVHGIARIELV
ncbi:hypothetical protein [Bacillus toyonensis]|uniref:hypothetical protein n=1 Tax=Bacillus toyonensis TaxID=155322 RepID=UPI000BF4F0EF|nr:hypothetical protein [Bacillus toyonensis]PGF05050.1 hypothetical protein COM61_01035 [Bacillus toyonensis]